jgi:hypothetical protein
MPQVSKVQRLNADDKAWLDDLLVARGFSGYTELEQLCRERGIDISSSAIHRYGQEFQERLDRIKVVTEQSMAIVRASSDDEGATNEALMRLAQEKLFNVLVDIELAPDNIAKVTKAIADLTRASVSQKKMAAEVRRKALEDAAAQAEKVGRKQGLTDEGTALLREAIMQELA